MKTDPDSHFPIVISGDEPYYPLHPSGIQQFENQECHLVIEKKSQGAGGGWTRHLIAGA